MKQQFTVGARIMARKKKDPTHKWGEATIIGTRLLAPDGKPWRHTKHTIEASAREYTVFTPQTEDNYGSYGMQVNDVDYWIESAGPKPYRSWWDGDVEITELHELQLFLIDFGLDGTDNDIIAQLEGVRLSDVNGTEHDEHARLVIEPRSGSRITINTLRLMHLAVQTE